MTRQSTAGTPTSTGNGAPFIAQTYPTLHCAHLDAPSASGEAGWVWKFPGPAYRVHEAMALPCSSESHPLSDAFALLLLRFGRSTGGIARGGRDQHQQADKYNGNCNVHTRTHVHTSTHVQKAYIAPQGDSGGDGGGDCGGDGGGQTHAPTSAPGVLRPCTLLETASGSQQNVRRTLSTGQLHALLTGGANRKNRWNATWTRHVIFSVNC